MGVIILAVQQGDTIVLEAEGDDEREAIESLTELIDSKFGIGARGLEGSNKKYDRTIILFSLIYKPR